MANIFNKTTPGGGEIKISFSILGTGFILLIIILVAILLLDHHFTWGIAFREYISISTFGCVTIGLIYNATALQYNFEISKQKLEKEKQENYENRVKITYEVISEWYKGDMATNSEVSRKFLQPYKDRLNEPKTLAYFKRDLNIEENINIRKSLTSVLNYFEHLSLLCADHVIDEIILRKTFRTAFLTYYTTLKEFIEDEQRGNSGANSKIYINYVSIIQKWMYL